MIQYMPERMLRTASAEMEFWSFILPVDAVQSVHNTILSGNFAWDRTGSPDGQRARVWITLSRYAIKVARSGSVAAAILPAYD